MLELRPAVVILAAATALIADGRLRADSLTEQLAAEGPRALAAAAVARFDGWCKAFLATVRSRYRDELGDVPPVS